VQGGGTLGSVPLPAHKVTPHDVVELRPSKGDASQPAIAAGIVHRYARLMRGHIPQATGVCSSFTQSTLAKRHWQLTDEGKLNSVVCFCRVKDTCIIVAVEEMPDEGLDQPLRLDKLANEVLLSTNQIKQLAISLP
jgi:ATP-dependent RNA/DNA helicase IGHMBP2